MIPPLCNNVLRNIPYVVYFNYPSLEWLNQFAISHHSLFKQQIILICSEKGVG